MPRRPGTAAQEHAPAPIWLQRVSLVILVVFCLYVGLLLLLLPWTRFWQENQYLLTIPALEPILNSGIIRGVVSGLGLLDIWIGISEALHPRGHNA